MSRETTLKSFQIKDVLDALVFAMSILNEVPTFMQEKFDPLESAYFTPSLQVLLVKQNSRVIPEHVEVNVWQYRTQ